MASAPLAGGPVRAAASRSGPRADARQDPPWSVSATRPGSCPFATPRSVVRQPRLVCAVDILPEIRHFMQDRLHVHLDVQTNAAAGRRGADRAGSRLDSSIQWHQGGAWPTCSEHRLVLPRGGAEATADGFMIMGRNGQI